MMSLNNKDFLLWIHARMNLKHGEPELVDYMWKLRKVAQEVEDTERDLLTLKADYSTRLDQFRDLLLEISKGQHAHIECTDRTSPTGLLIKELCK